MTYNYCTLFDSYYLNRGLAMHESLLKNSPEFHLYIFAFDKKSESILKDMALQNVTVISLEEFEDERLLAIKDSRSKGEYCWTCTSSTIYYCITRFKLDHCTYIDADLYFFSNPNVLVDEMGDCSVLITEHRYTKKYDQSGTSGMYCVQFITFKNVPSGMKALTWWRDRCIEWCYDRFEEGKFGDQKYLDDWPTRFEGVHVLQNLGGLLAPWNVQQFEIQTGDKIVIKEKITGRRFDLVFFHFHAVRFLKNDTVDLGAYTLSASAKQLYWTYLQNIKRIDQELRRYHFPPVVQAYQTKKAMPLLLHKIVRVLLGVYHLYNVKHLTKYGKNS
jgi:hypothetical protein